MVPYKVCTIIIVCAVLHYMDIVWKQPMLENYTIDYPTSIMNEPFAFEKTGRFTAKN